MIKHESYLTAVAADLSNTTTKGNNQIINGTKQHIRQNGALQMAPQPFDQVQAGARRQQPKYSQHVTVFAEAVGHCLDMVKSTIVTGQRDLPPHVRLNHRHRKGQKVQSTFACGHRMGNPFGDTIHRATDGLFVVLSWLAMGKTAEN